MKNPPGFVPEAVFWLLKAKESIRSNDKTSTIYFLLRSFLISFLGPFVLEYYSITRFYLCVLLYNSIGGNFCFLKQKRAILFDNEMTLSYNTG